MKFGVNTFIWSERFDKSQTRIFRSLKEVGFDGVELPLFEPRQAFDKDVRRALQESGLECTFCSVLPANLNTLQTDRDVRRRTVAHLLNCIGCAAEMGSHLVGGPLYAPVGYFAGRRRTSDEWMYAVDCFQQLGPELDRSDVFLAIEPLNRYETYFLNTVSDAVELCREIAHPRIGMLFDTYHANIEEKNVSEAIRVASPCLFHVHSCENDRGVPGSGHIDWPAVAGALLEIGYDRWITIEGFGFSLGALSNAASIWRDLAVAPEAIAFEGLPFLRTQFRRQ